MNIITTTNKKTQRIVVEDVLCDKHWEKAKQLSCFQSDDNYKVTVVKLENPELECQDCHD